MKHPLGLTVIMYHYIRERGDAAEAGSRIPGMSVSDFAAQLDELNKDRRETEDGIRQAILNCLRCS